jgi:hypothetical protein
MSCGQIKSNLDAWPRYTAQTRALQLIECNFATFQRRPERARIREA